jgi:hypothetical protein
MDTRAVADALNTDPKTLRRFLRDKSTSFIPVGSGSRYNFTSADLDAIRAQFEPWSQRQAAKASEKPVRARSTVARTGVTRADRDAAVWAEEAPVVLEDIRNPRVRAEVRRLAREAEARLTAQLLAAGLHVTQKRDRAAV